ncbi:MAG: ribonuclease HI family protein [Propionibacteriaceae bacterium]|nr:ribonuclease HI family protein [Propionibacteriaceae bacterium]
MILAAADGSSLANPGPSGWAWYIDDAHWAAGGWVRATNNMAELMSVLDLLRATKEVDEHLRILCDSQYVINCCTRWMPTWKKRGWRKTDNKPVLNLDLLKELDEELAGRKVSFQWVRGHSGHPMNEKADELARAAATAYQIGAPVVTGPGFSKAPIAVGDEAESPDSPQIDSEETAYVPDAEPTDHQPELIRLDLPAPDAPIRVRDSSEIVDLTELTRELICDETQLDRERLAELMHPEYVSHLPDGLIRTRGSILARPAVLSGTVHMDVYGVDRLGDDVVLLRFKMTRNSLDYLCVIVWQRVGAAWQARFFQYTQIVA